MSRVWAALLAVAIAAPLLFRDLGRPAFDDPGEGMHAEIARELARSRDPFDLRLGGVPYVDKPPLLYALVALAVGVGGRTEGAARAVPALAALVAVGATAWLGAALTGTGGGLLAGLALLTSPGFFAYARYLRPETLFVAALAGGFALVLEGLARERSAMVASGLAAFGVAALAKDPLGAFAPPLAIALALAAAGHLRPIRRWLPPAGVAALVGLGVGWWILVERRTPGFTWYTVVDNHILNVARARHFPDEDVPLPVHAFLAVALLGAAPWAMGAAATVGALVRRRAWRDPEKLGWVVVAVWAVGVLGACVLSPFRLPHYGLPAYPALALLAARSLTRGDGRRVVIAHAALLGAIAIACALALSTGGSWFMGDVMGSTDVATRKSALAGQAAPLPPWEAFRPLVAATAWTTGGGAVVTAALALVRGPLARRVALAALAMTALAVMPGVAKGLALVSDHRSVRGVAGELRDRLGAGDVVAHEGSLEAAGALEWYLGRRPVIVDGRRSVLGFGATLPGARSTFWDAAELARAWGERRVWVVTARPPERSLVARLPGARVVAAVGGRWLWANGARGTTE